MPLSPGTRLGPYQVVGSLGAGGMGEVYKARDTKLDRDVAVKVLPDHLANDPEALGRFEREAKAVAALSHPNILAIHDFGSHEGTFYAVTELLEGETLRERLAESGPQPPKKVVQIAADVARGLAAAHEKHIVHRDLKPENVFITADGQVKILDFGLAKAVVTPAGAEKTSLGTTAGEAATELKTDPGTVLGTVGYMAPEQVKGREADARSDIFALGCVLFEMATGERAFQRETAAETMTAILREDPPDLAGRERPLPPALDEVIRHCLEKRPEERFQSARDLAFALRALSGAQTTSGVATVAPAAALPRPKRLSLLVAAGLVVGAFLVGRWSVGESAGAAPAISSFEQVTDSAGVETRPTLSPDGQSIVYAVETGNDSDLYLLRVGSRRPIPLTEGSGARDTSPAFSPDGERIAFRSERDGGGIFVMNATGESVTRVSDVGSDPSWSPDGREVVVATAWFGYPTDLGMGDTQLLAIDIATGERRELARGQTRLQPTWSPNGLRVAYWGLQPGTGQRDLWTVAADGSEVETGGRPVTSDEALDWNPVWAPDGRYLYFSSNRGGTMNLWRMPIDQSTGEVLGDAEAVTTPSLWSGGVSFSADGSRMAFASLDWRSTLYRVAFDPAEERLRGSPELLRRSTRPIRDHELSPDGEWIAFMETGAQEDLFVARTDASEYRRLTDDAYRDRSPVWSPDGSRIAFYSDRHDGYQLWTIRPDGSELTQVTEWTVTPNFPTWSPDGNRLAAWSGGERDWFIADLSADDPRTPIRMEPPPPLTSFWPVSWGGSKVVGMMTTESATARGLGVVDLAAQAYAPLVDEAPRQFAMAVWLDPDRLIARLDGEIFVLHLDGRRTHLLDVAGYDIGRSIGVSGDGSWISYAETGTQGDIWLATIR